MARDDCFCYHDMIGVPPARVPARLGHGEALPSWLAGIGLKIPCCNQDLHGNCCGLNLRPADPECFSGHSNLVISRTFSRTLQCDSFAAICRRQKLDLYFLLHPSAGSAAVRLVGIKALESCLQCGIQRLFVDQPDSRGEGTLESHGQHSCPMSGCLWCCNPCACFTNFGLSVNCHLTLCSFELVGPSFQ